MLQKLSEVKDKDIYRSVNSIWEIGYILQEINHFKMSSYPKINVTYVKVLNLGK